jgi:hypothetical protein
MTPELAEKIRKYHKANPHLSRAAIGIKFNVNPGRVTESIVGKRK